jgi:hypothetical protein
VGGRGRAVAEAADEPSGSGATELGRQLVVIK